MTQDIVLLRLTNEISEHIAGMNAAGLIHHFPVSTEVALVEAFGDLNVTKT